MGQVCAKGGHFWRPGAGGNIGRLPGPPPATWGESEILTLLPDVPGEFVSDFGGASNRLISLAGRPWR
jgi:hypothetical protein